MLSGIFSAVLEYCTALWCSAADTHLKLLDCSVSGNRFRTGSVLQRSMRDRRSSSIRGSTVMLFKIRCNSMHPRYGALSGPYVPVRVTRCVLVAHRYTYAHLAAEPRMQYRRTFFPSQCPSGMILLTSCPCSIMWD